MLAWLLSDYLRPIRIGSYAILSDQVMVVSDAATDPRFRDNALVTGPSHIRFYAGATLQMPNGHICVLDLVPRPFRAQQQARLAHMAAMMVDELELRRTARELRESEAALRQALHQNSPLLVAISQGKRISRSAKVVSSLNPGKGTLFGG